MLPELIPHFGIGPFFGFAANAVMAILCLVTMGLYLRYRPLRSLFLFYLFLTFCFLGWVVYGLQKTPESILLGYRIDYAALAVLPACWVWFVTALFNERIGWLTWLVTGISLILAALALFGKGLYLFGLPLEPDPVALDILRPQSKLLRPLIQYFCLMVCLFYFLRVIVRLQRFKDQRPVYLLPVGLGLLFWFLGGLHDAARSTGVAILIKEQVLWFTSLWLSIFLTIAVAFHFRSLEQTARQELERLNRAKSKALDHLSHELRTPLAVIQGKIRLLKRELQHRTSVAEKETFFETLERHLRRLLDIQQETDEIIRFYQELERSLTHDEIDRRASFETIFLLPFAERILEKVRQRAIHRKLHTDLEGARDLWVWMDPRILEDILEGLLKNAIENTPDEGLIRILVEQKGQRVLLKVQDFGV